MLGLEAQLETDSIGIGNIITLVTFNMSTALHAPKRRHKNHAFSVALKIFFFAMFGSFWGCFNSSAAPAADEIWVQKKRTVSDALIAKNGIIRAIWGLRYGSRDGKPDCRVSAERNNSVGDALCK